MWFWVLGVVVWFVFPDLFWLLEVTGGSSICLALRSYRIGGWFVGLRIKIVALMIWLVRISWYCVSWGCCNIVFCFWVV